MIKEGKCNEDLLKLLFPTAYTAILKSSKDLVTEEDVRKYFLLTHNKFVQKARKGFCTAYLAKVEKCYGNECDVRHKEGRERVRCFEELKEGDFVIVHLGYVAEKYDKNLRTW